jgi:hypothetical protein
LNREDLKRSISLRFVSSGFAGSGDHADFEKACSVELPAFELARWPLS